MTSVSKWGTVAGSSLEPLPNTLDKYGNHLWMQQRTAEAWTRGGELWRGEDLEEMSWHCVAIFNLGTFVNYQCRQNLGFVPIGATSVEEKNQRSFGDLGGLELSTEICAEFWGCAEHNAKKLTGKISERHMELFGSFMRKRFRVWDLFREETWRSQQNFK